MMQDESASHHVVDVEDDGFTGHSSILWRGRESERSAVLSMDGDDRVQDGEIVHQLLFL